MSHLVREIDFVTPSTDEDEGVVEGNLENIKKSTSKKMKKKKKKKITEGSTVSSDVEAALTSPSSLRTKKKKRSKDTAVASMSSNVADVRGDGSGTKSLSNHSRSSKKTKKKLAVPVSATTGLPVVVKQMHTKSNLCTMTTIKESPSKKSMDAVGKVQVTTMPIVPMVDPMVRLGGTGDDFAGSSRRPRQSGPSKPEERPGAFSSCVQSFLFGRVRASESPARESNHDEVPEAVTVRATPIDEAVYRDEVRQEILREQQNSGPTNDFSGTTPPLVQARVNSPSNAGKTKDSTAGYAVIGCGIFVILAIAIGLAVGLTRPSPPLVPPSTLQPSQSLTPQPSDTSPTPCEALCQGLTGSAVVYSDREDLKRAILEYLRSPLSSPHGSLINCWDVSQVTDMSFAFSYYMTQEGETVYNPELNDPLFQTFNEHLDCWNTSSVTNMRAMFANATSFKGNIGTWDVSQVTDMGFMFFLASSFNADIDDWNVQSVTDMSFMFAGATTFNADIGNWDVSSVQDMGSMFDNAESFNANIGLWDTSRVLMMDWMFNGAIRFNQPIGSWDTSNVRDMTRMLSFATTFDQDIGDWDVANVIDMFGMFSGTAAFDSSIEEWDVSNVGNMSSMFESATSFNQPLAAWNTMSLINTSAMFYKAASFNQPIFVETSMVEDISFMFYGATEFSQPLNSWDVSNVKTMNAAFYEASSFNYPLNSWIVSQCEDFSYMFNRADLFDQPIGSWDVSNATNLRFMFFGAFKFNQNLCPWGYLIDTSQVNVEFIFDGSNCENSATPSNISTSWCQECD